MTAFQSSQNFIRHLKAPTDPPLAGGPYKVEIAQEAWNDASFYVPNTAEVIADWLLTKLLKDKGKDLLENPIFDLRYWKLLYDVLAPQEFERSNSRHRTATAWVGPLLQRVPIGHVVVVLLTIHPDTEGQIIYEGVIDTASSCLAILWPLAAQKMNTEGLLECWGALLTATDRIRNTTISKVATLITTSYRNSLTNNSNKKKIYNLFIQNHLQQWVRCTILMNSSDMLDSVIQENIFNAGIDTIFNVDILRQNQDLKSENTLLDSLTKVESESHNEDMVISIIPRLFEAYIRAIRKYRGTLFGQGSNQPLGAASEEFHAASMQFCASCLALLDGKHQNVLTWRTRATLLSQIDKENIFHQSQKDSVQVLNNNIDKCISTLAKSWEEDQIPVSISVVQCLSAIMRLDYDLIMPMITRILPCILSIPGTNQECSEFLDLLLAYHTKTRTLPTHLTNLLSIMTPNVILAIPKGPREVYQLCFSGSLMHSSHMNRISKAVMAFLSPGQVIAAVGYVIDVLKMSWDAYQTVEHRQDANNGDGPRKKRKTEEVTESPVDPDPEVHAVAYALSARLASVVFSSLPVQSLLGEARKVLFEVLKDFRESFLEHSMTKTLKFKMKSGHGDVWSAQIVGVATLRVQYALEAFRNLDIAPLYNEKMCKKMLRVLEGDHLLPEFALEIFRYFFCRFTSIKQIDSEDIIDRALSYIGNLMTEEITWSGESHHLTFGKKDKLRGGLALLHLVLERWLPVVENIASTPQLERLIESVLSAFDATRSSPRGLFVTSNLAPQDLLMRVLRSAQFWELRRLRPVLLAHMNEKIGLIDLVTNEKEPIFALIDDILIAYRLLLFFPVEYLTRTNRTDFVRRAVAVDLYLGRVPYGEECSVSIKREAWTVLRVFLRRVYLYMGSTDQHPNQDIPEYLEHVLSSEMQSVAGGDVVEEFTLATVDLAELYLSELIRSAERSNPDGLLKVLLSFSQHKILEDSSCQLRSQTFIRMVERLSASSVASFPAVVQTSIRDLHEQHALSLKTAISTIIDSGTTFESTEMLFAGWCSLLSLGRWLGLSVTSIPYFGQALVRSVLLMSNSKSLPSRVYASIFSVVLQELYYQSEEKRIGHLNLIAATYISFSRLLSGQDHGQLDELLGRTTKSLSPSEYSHITELVSESLSIPAPEQIIFLVHFSAVLLHEHPQNTLRHMQTFATRCFSVFGDQSIYTTGFIQLRLKALELVAQHCSDRPATLRLADINNIYLFLLKLLAPSNIHDEITNTGIFHKVVSIVSSSIRLRRDLVTHLLPHLGLILRHLLFSTRNCRPNLGGKQTKLVMDTQPRWISATQALGAEEGKALARLLEALNTKTVPRLNTSTPNEAHKAESLAKPFSKHAASVLLAYIEAMNDPLCVLSMEMRRELQPGLYGLCHMMSEHSRDAMMVSSLDSGGKTTMKMLWREYEKQKYVGKG